MRDSGTESPDEVTQNPRLETRAAVEHQDAWAAQVDRRLFGRRAVEHRGAQRPAQLRERAAGEGPLRLHPPRGRLAIDEHDAVARFELILLRPANLIGRIVRSDEWRQGR